MLILLGKVRMLAFMWSAFGLSGSKPLVGSGQKNFVARIRTESLTPASDQERDIYRFWLLSADFLKFDFPLPPC